MGALEAHRLAKNSFEASFIDASAKKRYTDRLDEAFATFA
jgi:adenosine deaminase